MQCIYRDYLTTPGIYSENGLTAGHGVIRKTISPPHPLQETRQLFIYVIFLSFLQRFLSVITEKNDQCKEIEENNRMGKTRNLFKKIRDKGNFHVKMGTVKERNGGDLIEA